MTSISHQKRSNNYLTEIRKEIGSAQVVATVQKLYPKFDKTLESKCENPKYGIRLRSDAKKLLTDLYGTKRDVREKSRRIQLRVHPALGNRLAFYLGNDKITIQDFLESYIKSYVEMKENQYDTEKSIDAQYYYCNHKCIRFAPYDGICEHCHRQIYAPSAAGRGYSLYEAAHTQITSCPHCHKSFVD